LKSSFSFSNDCKSQGNLWPLDCKVFINFNKSHCLKLLQPKKVKPERVGLHAEKTFYKNEI